MNNPSISFCHVHEESNILHLTWLPNPTPQLLIGVKDWTDKATGTILDAEQALAIATALDGRHAIKLSAGGAIVRLTPANRGEPYREGMELSVCSEKKENSIFLEYDNTSELCELIRKRVA